MISFSIFFEMYINTVTLMHSELPNLAVLSALGLQCIVGKRGCVLKWLESA